MGWFAMKRQYIANNAIVSVKIASQFIKWTVRNPRDMTWFFNTIRTTAVRRLPSDPELYEKSPKSYTFTFSTF